jgi:hypothetical protein
MKNFDSYVLRHTVKQRTKTRLKSLHLGTLNQKTRPRGREISIIEKEGRVVG